QVQNVMSAPTSQPPVKSSGRPPLRIVVAGMPNSGKSSLLGALAQAAQTQQTELQAELIDPSGELQELQRRLSEAASRHSREEVTLRPVPLRSLVSAKPPVEVLFVECVAYPPFRLHNPNALEDPLGPDRPPTPSPFEKEVLAADALLLLLDIAALPVQTKA